MPFPNTETDFWALVDKVGKRPEECWPWKGGKFLTFRLNGLQWHCRRLALALEGKEPPPELEVSAVCKNALCVNPSHFELLPHSEIATRSNRARWRNSTQGIREGKNNLQQPVQL
jgi:hypothetical protein